MFAAAARQLAASVTDADLAGGSLFPRVRDIRRVTAGIAAAVVREARDCGVGRSLSDDEIAAHVAGAMWEPAYLPLEPEPARVARVEEALAGTTA
jgi:malate dehydrogenase (oxaloacetate-decarboxylating)